MGGSRAAIVFLRSVGAKGAEASTGFILHPGSNHANHGTSDSTCNYRAGLQPYSLEREANVGR